MTQVARRTAETAVRRLTAADWRKIGGHFERMAAGRRGLLRSAIFRKPVRCLCHAVLTISDCYPLRPNFNGAEPMALFYPGTSYWFPSNREGYGDRCMIAYLIADMMEAGDA